MSHSANQTALIASPKLGLKARLKRALKSKPRLWSLYWRTKQQILRVLLLRYFMHDMRVTYRAMFWHEAHTKWETLSSELLFQYHKIEKGLAMPGPHRFFGMEPALATMALCDRWIAVGHDRGDPVFIGAIETLRAHEQRLRMEDLDAEGKLLPNLQSFLRGVAERDESLATPQALRARIGSQRGDAFSFSDLAVARRSVRQFLPEPVSADILRAAARDAQLSPSACNRQPCRLRIVSGADDKRALLRHQNGNRGFGHLVPHVAILTADARCFFDASERHEPYIDGGLFAMSFILSLSDKGVASCCLNWCVPPATDRTVHRTFEIPPSEQIIMLIAIGLAPGDCVVPRSPRRTADSVLRFI